MVLAGWVAAVVAVSVLVVYPLGRLLAVALTEARAPGGIAGPVVNTLWVGCAVTALAVAGGTAAALVTERSAARGRRGLRVGMILPLLIPSFVAALSWMRAYGPGGLTDDLWGWRLPGLVGPGGIVLVLTVHTLPLAYAVAAAGLRVRADSGLERAARTSGAGPWTALRTVTLPLIAPALAGAAALVFVAAANSFGIPAILGLPADFLTITTRIYRDLAFSADPAAFARAVLLAALLVAVALAVVGGVDGVTGETTPRTASPSGPVMVGRAWWQAAIVWLYLALTTAVPFLALVAFALTRAVGLPAVPANWTLAHFAEAVGGRFAGALGRSALLGVVAATLVLVLGALLTSLRRRRGGRVLGTVALLAFSIPGSTLAVAVLMTYGRWLRDTLAIILVAYLAKLWAVGHRTLAGAADALPEDVTRAARVSGAGWMTASRTVVIPLLAPALGAAWALVFLFAFHELTMSSLLYGPGTDTLAVVVLNLQQLGDVGATSALAVLLTLPALVLAIPLLGRRSSSVRALSFE